MLFAVRHAIGCQTYSTGTLNLYAKFISSLKIDMKTCIFIGKSSNKTVYSSLIDVIMLAMESDGPTTQPTLDSRWH